MLGGIRKTVKSEPHQVLDPEDMLTGTCATCKATVTISRWQATPPAPQSYRSLSEAPRLFEDLYRTACLGCGANIFLRLKVR